MGLNIYRKIRRVNEESHWAPLPRRYNMTRVSLAGTLTGLEGVSQGRNLKIKPYGKAEFTQTRPDGKLENESDFNGGFDAKYGLTQSLTLDVTYRTDFSQAEVDQDQVNQLSTNIRFNIIHHPLSDIFVVFNERRDTITGEVLDRGVVFKFTNLFNF